jgi:GTPase
MTRAFPKIAHYPFTTLRPHIGHAKFVDGSSLIMADLPGIIEGAHLNKGLGHQFLQHAERTKAILYVIDGTEIIDERNPIKDLNVLLEELRLYKGGMLLSKPGVIVS